MIISDQQVGTYPYLSTGGTSRGKAPLSMAATPTVKLRHLKPDVVRESMDKFNEEISFAKLNISDLVTLNARPKRNRNG